MLKHLVDFNDLELHEWDEIYQLCEKIIANPAAYANTCKDKILATLFYEPSTRTMLSFQAAMLRLGGQVIGFDNPGTSSVAKGENLKDTISVVSTYADILVIRHYNEGAALAASRYSTKPVINAGDGGHLHPTQTLCDLVTIKKYKDTLEGLTIGVCGDLLNGRTVHSLLKALSRYKNNRFYLISTQQLTVPHYIKEILAQSGNTFVETSSITDCIGQLDVLYMTRIQKERFESEKEYEKQKNVFCLDTSKMKLAKENLIVLHPLPKVDEIEEQVDFDRRAVYFKQAEYGMYVRMALIIKMLDNRSIKREMFSGSEHTSKCPNPKCVTAHEKYLPQLFYSKTDKRSAKACKYCDFNIR